MTYSKVPGKRKLPGTYPHKTCTPISEETADALYDAATAQYAHQTLKLLRREYDLASPDEQEAIDDLIERGAQIVFNSDLPEAYVTVDKWQQINPHKWGIDDWADSIREIFIEDDRKMNAMNGHITDILYNAAAARHAFTLLVNLRRAYKNAPENERAILTQLHDGGAYIKYSTDGYESLDPFIILADAPGRSVNHESVSNWFNAVTYVLLGESRDGDGETVHVNKPEIMSALAFMNFNEVNLDYRLSIIPDNWMVGLFRHYAESYTKCAARLLSNTDNN